MPVAKKDALKSAEQRDKKMFEKLCEEIDEAIAANAGTGRQITLSTNGYPRHVISRAIETYQNEEFDWKCELHPDQREGDYLELS